MIDFYNVKKKKIVLIKASEIDTKTYEQITATGKKSIRYALTAVDDDETKLVKFCSKEDYLNFLKKD